MCYCLEKPSTTGTPSLESKVLDGAISENYPSLREGILDKEESPFYVSV